MSKLPLIVKIPCWLISIVLGAVILVYAKDFLLPIVVAGLLSFLLYPVYKKLTDWKVPSVLSVIASLLLIVVLIVTTAILVSTQIKTLITDIGGQSNKMNERFNNFQTAISSHLNMDSSTVAGYLAEAKTKLVLVGESLASGAVSTTTDILGKIALIIIFIFCFLLYQRSFRDFAFALLRKEKHKEASSLITHIQKLVQNYLLGMLTVILIVGTLNSIGLLLIGVDHAIFFAFFAGMLTIIPYIGISIGSGLAVIYLLLTKDSALPAVGTLAILITVQILESNFITPKVVGSKVSLNPFVAITALLIGGELWGIPGMALSIPLTAILKLVLDMRPQTKAMGYFLGNEFTDTKTNPLKVFGKQKPEPPKE